MKVKAKIVIACFLLICGMVIYTVNGDPNPWPTVYPFECDAYFNMKIDGNVGIGITLPEEKLDVRGHMILDPGGNPYLYTGTGSAELNRYLCILNSPDNGTASGLKAGGVLISDTYAWGDPGKNDLLVKGNVGIGTNNPTHKLHILTDITGNGTGSIVLLDRPDASNYENAINYATAGTKQWFFGLDNDGSNDLYLYDWTGGGGFVQTWKQGGNVGIGVTSPTVKFDVAGTIKTTGFILPTGANAGYVLKCIDAQGNAEWRQESGGSCASCNGWTDDGANVITDFNVGIGMTSPAVPTSELEVKGTITASPIGASGYTGYVLKGATGSEVIKLGTDNQHPYLEHSYLHMYDNTQGLVNTISFNADPSVNSWIKAGNVGIGTDLPSTKLDVTGTITGTNLTIADKVEASGYTGYVLKGATGSEVIKLGTDNQHPYLEHSYLHMYDNTQGLVNTISFNANPSVNSWINAGKVGIGTSLPDSKLDVAGAIRQSGPSTSTILYHSTTESGTVTGNGNGFRIRYEDDFFTTSEDALVFEKTEGYGPVPDGGIAFVNRGVSENVQVAMYIKGDGNIGIGKTNPGEKLDVDGYVKADGFKVDDWVIETPDYVFNKGYNLRSLKEVKNYVEIYKHLPEVPSAKEMKEKGVDLAEMNMTLLKKVEELTLYVIQQNERIVELEKRVR